MTCSDELSEAYDIAKTHGLEPLWTMEDECAKMTPSKTVRYLFPDLENLKSWKMILNFHI